MIIKIIVTEYVADFRDGGLSKFGGDPSGFGIKGILERSASGGMSIVVVMMMMETRAICKELRYGIVGANVYNLLI